VTVKPLLNGKLSIFRIFLSRIDFRRLFVVL